MSEPLRLKIGMSATHVGDLKMQHNRVAIDAPEGATAEDMGLYMARNLWPISAGWTRHRAWAIQDGATS